MINEKTYKRVYYWKKILHGIALLTTAMSMSLPTKRPKKPEKARKSYAEYKEAIDILLEIYGATPYEGMIIDL